MLDMVGGEDAYESERALASRPVESARPGQVWIADRHVCTRPLLEGWAAAGACFIVREHAEHPRGAERGAWQRSIAVSKRTPKLKKPKGYTDGAAARVHVATARVMAKAKPIR